MTPRLARRLHCVPPPNARAEVVLVHGDVEVASWALLWPGRPDLALVDELARLQHAARRLGCSIWLRHACPQLSALLELVGLADVVPSRAGRLQVGGQAEDGEQPGVEEVVVPDDPVARDLDHLQRPRGVSSGRVDPVGPEGRGPVGRRGHQP